jgi:hypothetical protein
MLEKPRLDPSARLKSIFAGEQLVALEPETGIKLVQHGSNHFPFMRSVACKST